MWHSWDLDLGRRKLSSQVLPKSWVWLPAPLCVPERPWASYLTSLSCSFPCIKLGHLLFSCSIVSDSLWPQGLQHARPLCPSPSAKLCPSSCPLLRWWYPAISSSDALFSFCPQSFPASATFPMSWLFASMTKILEFQLQQPSNKYSGLISLNIDCFDLLGVQGTLRSLLQHHSLKASILWQSYLLYGPALITICDYWEDHNLDCMDLCRQSNVWFSTHCLCVSYLSCQEARSRQEASKKPKKRKSVTISTFSPFYLPWRNGAGCHDLSLFNI